MERPESIVVRLLRRAKGELTEGPELALGAAIELVCEGVISEGKACEVLGINRLDFRDAHNALHGQGEHCG